MPGAPSGLVTIERVSQGKPWAKLCWPVGPKTWLYLSIFPPENARPNSEHPPRGNKTSKIHLNLAPFSPGLNGAKLSGQMNVLRPGGTRDSSPAIYRRVNHKYDLRPGGTPEGGSGPLPIRRGA